MPSTIGDTSAHTRYERASKMPSDSLLAGVKTPRSDEYSLKHIELMKICTTLQKKVLDVEDELKRTKTAQQSKIDGLEKRVISSSNDEALGKKDTSKQGRIDKIEADEDIALVSTHDDVVQDEDIEDAGEEEVVNVVTTAKMLIDTAVDATQVTTAIADIPVSASETIVTTTPTITAESTKTNVELLHNNLRFRKKGKGKLKLIEEPVKLNKKDQILFDKEVARKLQEEIYEQERLLGERARQEEEANSALIETWEAIQAKVDADYQLAKRLQAKEQEQLTNAEKAKLMGRDTQESSSKRAGDELDQERSKIQKVEDDKESEELKKCLEIILDDGDEVTINAIPLSSKSPIIVDYKIHKEGKKNYF
nr:hypothetical protein [Tanacetum cinerariifolium]